MADHVVSRSGPADGWLVDRFGGAHAVAAARTRIGRGVDADLVVQHPSVSRDHAELARHRDGWRIRDIGSLNATRVNGQRVDGRAAVSDLATVRIGDIAFLFVARAAAIAAWQVPATTQASSVGRFRLVLRGPTMEMTAPGSADDRAGAVLQYRATRDAPWRELDLPPLEYHLLRVLSASALGVGASGGRSASAVPTMALARTLPFQSAYANDENVRQIVRRLRMTLAEIGADEVIETAPGRGYFIAWEVTLT